MNIELIDALLKTGASEDEILSALKKRKKEQEEDKKLVRARDELVEALVEWLFQVDPDVFKDVSDEEVEEMAENLTKEVAKLEKTIKNLKPLKWGDPKTLTKTKPEDSLYKWLCKNDLM